MRITCPSLIMPLTASKAQTTNCCLRFAAHRLRACRLSHLVSLSLSHSHFLFQQTTIIHFCVVVFDGCVWVWMYAFLFVEKMQDFDFDLAQPSSTQETSNLHSTVLHQNRRIPKHVVWYQILVFEFRNLHYGIKISHKLYHTVSSLQKNSI